MKTFDTDYSGDSRSRASIFINAGWRVLQLIAAVVVIGYYASDLHAAAKEHKYSDSKWAFAVVVGVLSAVTAIVYLVMGFLSHYKTIAIVFGWDWVLTILWGVVSGIFCSMYLREKPEGDTGIQKMKVAAGFDLANLILWFFSATMSTIVFLKRPKRSLHTGRAEI